MTTVRCPICRGGLTDTDPPACTPCNTPVRHEYDDRGRIALSFNARGQRAFQARAQYRLGDTAPSRAHAGYDAPLDAWTAPALGGAQIKPRTP